MKKPSTSIEKTRIEKKISIIVGSLFLVAIVGAVILGVMFPATIPYSLEILRWSALFLLAAIAWRGAFNAMDNEEDKQQHYQHSL